MQDLMINGNTGSLTMSSREIEKLTGKRHADILSDIRKMCESLNIHSTDFSAEYKDSTGRTLPCFHLPKRETLILVSGYNVKMRAAIVDRWQELEAKQGMPPESSILKHISPVAKVIIEDLNGTIEHLSSETKRLNAVCNDLAANLREGVTPPAFARMLNGVNSNRVQPVLVERKRLIKTSIGYRSAAAYRDKLFAERRGVTQEGQPFEHVILTLKGAKWLYAEYEKGRLEMRKDWDGKYSHLTFDQGEAA